MKYYKYLYCSDSLKNSDKIKARLKIHKGVAGIFVIMISASNQLEIMASYFLKLPFYRKYPPIIIGLTKSYEEAIGIIMKITEESIERTGNADLIEYLKLKAYSKDFTS